MKRTALIFLALALSAGTTSCTGHTTPRRAHRASGSSDTDETSLGRDTDATPPPGSGGRPLEDALLTTGDLPAGWTATSASGRAASSDAATGEEQTCTTDAERPIADAVARGRYRDPDRQAEVAEKLGRFTDRGSEVFADLVGYYVDCPEISYTTKDGAHLAGRLGAAPPLDVPGDSQVYEATITDDTRSLNVQVAVLRRGDIVGLITYVRLPGSAPVAFEQLVTTAAERLR